MLSSASSQNRFCLEKERNARHKAYEVDKLQPKNGDVECVEVEYTAYCLHSAAVQRNGIELSFNPSRSCQNLAPLQYSSSIFKHF